MTLLSSIIFKILGTVLLGGYVAFLVMLSIGNFGFSQFGFIDCAPLGFLITGVIVYIGASGN